MHLTQWNTPEINFDEIDKIKDTDFKNLEDMKKDFMEPQPGLFYLDFKYDTSFSTGKTINHIEIHPKNNIDMK